MVVPSSSLSSELFSEGSKTIDSPRKRREYPRTHHRRRYKIEATTSTSGSNVLSPEVQKSTPTFTRPPQSPKSKLDHSSEDISNKAGSPYSPSVQGFSLQQSRSCPSVQSRMPSKSPSHGKPPVAPSLPKLPSSNSFILSKTLSRTKYALSRTNSVLSKSSKRSVTSRSTIVSIEQREESSSSNRQTFYVRVCLGYLTGLKVETRKKGKSKVNDLVVGYAVLAKSGKRIALSQPLGPNATEDGTKKQIKVNWANPKGEARTPSRLSKKKLLFSLKLEKEQDRESTQTEDDSLHSHAAYSPEVVKIIVGLKCGDEKYPLGIANLVINGTESMREKVDLAVRPLDEVPMVGSKARRNYLDRKKIGITFKDHGTEYCLSPNATLRVRIDVTPGAPGERKEQIWGDGDDGSYITNFTLDTRGTGCTPEILQASKCYSTSTQNAQNIPSNGKTGEFKCFTNEEHLSLADLNERETNQKFPVRYVIIDNLGRGDDRSISSSITSPSSDFMCRWTCFDLCGDSNDAADGENTGIDSAVDELPSWNASVVVGDRSKQYKSLSSGLPSSTSPDEEDRTRPTSRALEEVKYDGGPLNNQKARKHVEMSSHDETPNGEAFRMTDAAYEDLRGAQATLRWYAKKVGVDMEDLLDDGVGDKDA